MRQVAFQLIKSLGFETIHLANHTEVPKELSGLAHEVDAIFVLGSIQYSDAWPSPTLQDRIERSIRFHRYFPKAKVVFLPATWGAFERHHKLALAELVDGATVLVRDRFSAESINGLLGKNVAHYCPDLAFLYPTTNAANAAPFLKKLFKDTTRPLLGIIPNQRCIQQSVTPLPRPRDYFEILSKFRDLGTQRGFNVVGISHMINTPCDAILLKELNIPCVISRSKLEPIRAVIANLNFCVCSRYHGLISCLSHKVPLIALGWHHKYRNLMNDFGLGIHHLSVGDLPQDPTPLFECMIDRELEIRNEISNNVKLAQQLITAKTGELRDISFIA